jgi:hypothetical protein
MQHTVAPIVPQCASRLDHGWFQQPFAGWALNGYYCPWFPSPILYLRRGCIRTPLFQRKRKRSDNDQIPAT